MNIGLLLYVGYVQAAHAIIALRRRKGQACEAPRAISHPGRSHARGRPRNRWSAVTARQTSQIEIDKPRQAVWRQISALADVPAWYSEWDRCVHDPDQTSMREGQAFRLVGDGAKRTRVADCRVITVEEPTLVRWMSIAGYVDRSSSNSGSPRARISAPSSLTPRRPARYTAENDAY